MSVSSDVSLSPSPQPSCTSTLIKHKNYKQFVCDETLKGIEDTRRIFAGAYLSLFAISVILAATVSGLHYVNWSGSHEAGLVIGVVHTVILVVFNFTTPQRTTAELSHMRSWAMSYATTKAHMPADLLNDMLQVNTWCVKHPLSSTECKTEIDQRL